MARGKKRKLKPKRTNTASIIAGLPKGIEKASYTDYVVNRLLYLKYGKGLKQYESN